MIRIGNPHYLASTSGRCRRAGTLVYTLYDHFGLDWEDILKFQSKPLAGDGFKAWYIL